MRSAYMLALLISISGLLTIDYRYKLVWFKDAKRALKVFLPTYVLFLIWDLLGISLGIFFMGESRYMLGWVVAPEVPVEELLFLALLIYLPLLLWQYLKEVRHV